MNQNNPNLNVNQQQNHQSGMIGNAQMNNQRNPMEIQNAMRQNIGMVNNINMMNNNEPNEQNLDQNMNMPIGMDGINPNMGNFNQMNLMNMMPD